MRFAFILAWLALASLPALAAEKQSFAVLQSMADSGDADAQHDLGLYYLNGEGVERNETEGYFWGCLSERCRSMHFFCAESLKKQPFDKHWEIQKRIESWRPTATLDLLARAEEGYLKSQFAVANLYLSGGDCKKKGPFEKNESEALFWFSLVVARQAAGRSREDTMMIEQATAMRGKLVKGLTKKQIKALNGRIRAWRPLLP